MLRILSKFVFSTVTNYDQQAKEIIIRSYENLKKQKNLAAINTCLQDVYPAKFGLFNNKLLFRTFLQDSLPILKHNLFHASITKQSAETIYNIFYNARILQIDHWEANEYLHQWLKDPKTLNQFQNLRTPLLFIKFFNLAKLPEMIPLAETFIQQFQKKVDPSFEVQIEYFKAIRAIRPFDFVEHSFLKSTIINFAAQESTIMGKSRAFQTVIADAIELASTEFFDHAELFHKDFDEDLNDYEGKKDDDLELVAPLQRLIRLLLQQDNLWYKKGVSEILALDGAKADLVELSDPLMWDHLKAVTYAIFLLVELGETDKNTISMLEDAVFRKLETDTVMIPHGAIICRQLYEMTDKNKGKSFMILQSICDQINNQEFHELDLGRLASLYSCILRLRQIATAREAVSIDSALNKLDYWVKEGKFDDKMGVTDWVDLFEVTENNQYTEISKYVMKKMLFL